MRPNMRLLPAIAAVGVALACGKSSSPTDPTDLDNPTAAAVAATPSSYVGSVTLPGRTGVLVINTSGSFVSSTPSNALAGLLDFIEPRVFAQGTAGGTLALDDGTTIWLTGSGGGGSLQLSGSDGYSVTASVVGGTLSGTVTAPAGSGAVSPLVSVTRLAEDPGDPNGGFEAAYTMTTTGYFRNLDASNRTTRDCGYTVELTGTLRLDVPGHSFSGSGLALRRMQFRNSWRETRTILPPCPAATNFSPTVMEAPEGGYLEIVSRRARDVHQFGVEDKTTNPNGSTTTRVVAFMGVYASEDMIQGTLVRMANSVVPTNNGGRHFQGFAPVQTAVTFQKVSRVVLDARKH
jgi:hypothetical protein